VILLLVMTFFCAFAQENSDEVIRDIEARFQPIATRPNPYSEVKPQDIRGVPPQRIEKADIFESPIIQKAIQRLARVERISDQKTFVVTKRLVLNVHTQTDDHDFYYISSPDKSIKYRVHSKYAEDLNEITTLYEPPRFFSEVTERKNVSPYDQPLKWLYELSGGLSLNSAGWVADLSNDPKTRLGTGTQIKTHALADMGDRFRLGGALNFESANYKSSTSAIGMQNLSLGLIGKSKPIESAELVWRLSAEVRYSLLGRFSQSTSNDFQTYSFRSTALAIGWESLGVNLFGPWSWGVNLQRDWPKVVRQKDFFIQRAKTNYNDSLILQLTQGFQW
jgi:hypothetical protein